MRSIVLTQHCSGYQAAVLAHLARRVYTIEIVPGLADSAATRLQRLGYSNVVARTGDGYYGWGEARPSAASVPTMRGSEVRINPTASPKCGLLNQSHTRSTSCRDLPKRVSVGLRPPAAGRPFSTRSIG
jgi:hypothetical protein